MPKKKLTDRGVKALSTEKAQQDYWDTLTPGLCCRVSGETGSKTWYVRYRANGKRRRLKLGRYPEVSLAEARDEARGVLADAQAGEDPALDHQIRRSEDTTFGALAAEVLEAKKPPRTRQATHDEYKRIVDSELLPRWKNRPVASITRREVLELVEQVAERAPVMANRVLAIVKVIFNTGLKRGFPTLEFNPAHRMEPPAVEEGRDRFLDRDEVKAVWEATGQETPIVRCLFRLALLTGQRIGSIKAMRWADVDGDTWRIPEDVFKGRRPHLVPLSAEALAILKEMRPISGAGEYVFPGRSDGTHMTGHNAAMRRIRDRTDIPSWTVHDFRTTFRTHATTAEPAGLGVAPHVADAVLGHKEASLGFERYTGNQDRYLLTEKREALERWGAFVRAAVDAER